MLLRFTVQNHLSLRDAQELTLIASTLSDAEGQLLSSPAIDEKVLPCIVVYGANASGKSNVIQSLSFLKQAVLRSQTAGEARGRIPRQSFALGKSGVDAPTILDIDFIAAGQRYNFGFEASDDAFISEWLYSYPNGRQTRMFVRRGDDFEFGRSFKGANRSISQLTRPNSLFLSAAAQFNHAAVGVVIDFFKSMMVDRDISLPFVKPESLNAEGRVDDRSVAFLRQIGTGVVSSRIDDSALPEDQLKIGTAILEAVKNAVPAEMKVALDIDFKTPATVQLGHKSESGGVRYLDLTRESAGTRRLLNVLGPIFKALDEGTLVIVDEMDSGLHTLASNALIAMFSDPSINKYGAQLIATVHDTNLLSAGLLRRDQIWFTEKGETGATSLYPLTAIATRTSDNLERGYLQGRYGAIPFSGDSAALIRSL